MRSTTDWKLNVYMEMLYNGMIYEAYINKKLTDLDKDKLLTDSLKEKLFPQLFYQ